jgi:hypothetical protein
MIKFEGDRNIGLCSCGFKRTGGISISGEENTISDNKAGGVVNEGDRSKEGFFRICEKCGHDKSEAIQMVSHEADIILFKCLKCGSSIRQTSGSKA